jgi:hypothetical protein
MLKFKSNMGMNGNALDLHKSSQLKGGCMKTGKQRSRWGRGILIISASFFILGAISHIHVFAQSAENRVEVLVRTIEDWKLDDYVDHRLFVKLDVVQKSLDNGNYKPAIGNLHAFKNEVAVILKISENTKRNFITNAQADALLNQADMIIASISDATVANVGTSGGSISVSDPSLAIVGSSVEVPQGALTSDTVITITPDNTAPAMASNFTNAGPAVDFGPSGQIFMYPVTIAIPYKPGSDLNKLKLLTNNGEGWVQVPITSTDPNRELVYAEVSHFSTYQTAEETGDPGAPVFNWINLWNINSAGNNVIAMGCSVTDPDGQNTTFIPKNISSLKMEDPNGSTYYDFIEGDYTFNWGTKQDYYWRFIKLATAGDPPVFPSSGTYKFIVTDVDGHTTEQTKSLSVDPIPVVDSATVQISRDGLNWISQVPNGGFEQVALTGQSLWIRWMPVDGSTTPPKVYYYRVQIRNRSQAVLHNSKVWEGYGIDKVEIPIEVLNDVLHERSFYRFRIEAFDTAYGTTASNKSESKLIPFTTGDLRLSDPVVDWALVYRNTSYYLTDDLRCDMMFIDPNTTRADPNLFEISVKMPNGAIYNKSYFDYAYSNGKINFYLKTPIALGTIPTGRILYQMTYNGLNYYFEDFFNYARQMAPPVATFGSNFEAQPFLVSKPFNLTWNGSLECKSYEGRIDLVLGSNRYSTVLYTDSFMTPVFHDGDMQVSYTVSSSILSSGNTYRWHVRCYDGTAWGDTDGRAASANKFFKIQ